MFEDYIAKLKQGKQLIVRYNDKCEDCLGNWWLEELYCYDNKSKMYRCYYPVSTFDKIFYTTHSENEMNFLLKGILTAYLDLKIESFRLIEEGDTYDRPT